MPVQRSWSRPTRACPACRPPNRVGDKFCIACGTALPPEAQPTQTTSSENRLSRYRDIWSGIGCGGWAILLVVFIVLIVLSAIIGIVIGDSQEPDQGRTVNPESNPTQERAEPTPIPMPTATLTPVPTATPTVASTTLASAERIWTTQELIQCDNATLARQLRNYLKTSVAVGAGTRAARRPTGSGLCSWIPSCRSAPGSRGTWIAKPGCAPQPTAGRGSV